MSWCSWLPEVTLLVACWALELEDDMSSTEVTGKAPDGDVIGVPEIPDNSIGDEEGKGSTRSSRPSGVCSLLSSSRNSL